MARIIPATWENFEAYKSNVSSSLHTFSEYIDNSVASYLKKHKGSVSGLKVIIDVVSNLVDDHEEQYFTVTDNAGGMDEDELYQAIIPDNRKGKKDTELNQYGVGMKLATFWFGRCLKIVTRPDSKHQWSLEIKINEKNLRENAMVDIVKNKEKAIIIDGKECETGTCITVSQIREQPNRIIKKRDIEKLIKGLGWRYSDLLNDFDLIIKFKSSNSDISEEWKVEPFKICPFVLNEAIEGLKCKRNTEFDSEKYRTKLLKNARSKYLENKEDIDSLTGNKNFMDALENNEPLEFEFNDKIETKDVKVKWGIIALDCTGKNNPYKYSHLEGFTLLNNGRAIMHGPNSTDETTKDGVQIKTYSFQRADASGDEAVYRRLFGSIDLTNVENADRNKTTFMWGPYGKKNINEISSKITKSLKDVLSVIQRAEKDEEVIKPKQKPVTTKKREKIQTSFNKSLPLVDFVPNANGGGKFSINKINFKGEELTIYIEHSNANPNEAFDVEYNINDEHSITIKLNDQHYMWKDYIYKTDKFGTNLKNHFIYPLALAFAICKIHYDDKKNSPLNDMAPADKLPSVIAEMSFSELFNIILNYFKGNK